MPKIRSFSVYKLFSIAILLKKKSYLHSKLSRAVNGRLIFNRTESVLIFKVDQQEPLFISV